MLEIKLQENLFDVKIKDRIFTIDADNIDNHQLIDMFVKKYRGNRTIDDTFIGDCKIVIDEILGKGSYDYLFEVDDLKPYYVILAIAEEIQAKFDERAMTERQKEKQNRFKNELEDLKNISKEFGNIQKQMDYTSSKYGMKNYVDSRKNRPSKNNKNRKPRNRNKN